VALRGSAFRVFACIRMPEMGAQIDVILRVLKGGLEDEIIDVSSLLLFSCYEYLFIPLFTSRSVSLLYRPRETTC